MNLFGEIFLREARRLPVRGADGPEMYAAVPQVLSKSLLFCFISGGTGSSKTTFLNALSNYIPRDERVITIEDSAEL